MTLHMKQQDSNRRTIRSRECPLPTGGPGDHDYIDMGIESFVLGPPFKLSTHLYTSLLLPLGKAVKRPSSDFVE